MPANSDHTGREADVSAVSGDSHSRLPVTWRPRQARIVVYALIVAAVTTMVVLAVILPDNWQLTDRLLMVAFGGVLGWAMSLLARPKIVATQSGLTVVNLVRTRVLAWPEIIDARMPEGEPWVSVDIADGTCLPAMGIQSADGQRAWEHLAQLRTMIAEWGEASAPEDTPD
ncbi:PH domain-containing protein [Lipingzhangella sp. LS1_29]|uniref:PH domain-containing protein n=1 Tax=Lipingzhangella rawalii TaxID=2055835 RepID=A0ABU2H377_9ACTN|nr:PH domain-containing protein [Lipingzhangella rawalii]MDS1269447.1 PH domain-containing protein [Lipingzhangella rawalii]